MKIVLQVLAIAACAVLFSCGVRGARNPLAAAEDAKSSMVGATKPTSNGGAIRDLSRLVDECVSIAIDLKRYKSKDPNQHRHEAKAKKLEKKLGECVRAARKVAKEIGMTSEVATILSRLSAIRPVFPLLIINPCVMPFIGEYMCGKGTSL